MGCGLGVVGRCLFPGCQGLLCCALPTPHPVGQGAWDSIPHVERQSIDDCDWCDLGHPMEESPFGCLTRDCIKLGDRRMTYCCLPSPVFILTSFRRSKEVTWPWWPQWSQPCLCLAAGFVVQKCTCSLEFYLLKLCTHQHWAHLQTSRVRLQLCSQRMGFCLT